jgi:hypothetical protein
MTVAFALSGGSSLGSIQVGVMQALAAEGITPDLLVGTSAGAINASWVAGGRPLDGLAEVWATLHRRDIFPLHPTVGLRAFMGRSDHFIPNTALRRMLRRLINFRLLEDAQIPVMLIATDAVTGDEVRLTAGPRGVPACRDRRSAAGRRRSRQQHADHCGHRCRRNRGLRLVDRVCMHGNRSAERCHRGRAQRSWIPGTTTAHHGDRETDLSSPGASCASTLPVVGFALRLQPGRRSDRTSSRTHGRLAQSRSSTGKARSPASPFLTQRV